MTDDPSASDFEVPDGTEDVFRPPGESYELSPDQYLKPTEEQELVAAMHIGRLTEEYSIYGHKFLLRTLSDKQELQVGLATKDYLASDGYNRAFKCAVVAACLLEVDGEPFYIPLSREEDEQSIFKKRWEKILEWYPLITDQIFGKFNELEQKVRELHEKLGKLDG